MTTIITITIVLSSFITIIILGCAVFSGITEVIAPAAHLYLDLSFPVFSF